MLNVITKTSILHTQHQHTLCVRSTRSFCASYISLLHIHYPPYGSSVPAFTWSGVRIRRNMCMRICDGVRTRAPALPILHSPSARVNAPHNLRTHPRIHAPDAAYSPGTDERHAHMVCRLLFVFVVSRLDTFFIREARSFKRVGLWSLLFGSAARCLKLLNPWNAEGEGRSSEVRGGCECGTG